MSKSNFSGFYGVKNKIQDCLMEGCVVQKNVFLEIMRLFAIFQNLSHFLRGN